MESLIDGVYKGGQLPGTVTDQKLNKTSIRDIEFLYVVKDEAHLDSFIRGFSKNRLSRLEDHAFAVCNLGEVIKRYDMFSKAFPKVRPYYALKANNLYPIGKLLFELGAGFDTSSMNEVKQALSYGAGSEDIVLAAAVKYPSHIRFCAQNNVPYMTFDNKEELQKMKDHFQNCKAILRISVADSGSRLQLSEKYGAELKDVEDILLAAKEVDIDVVGVSFHVGWHCRDVSTYLSAMQDAKSALLKAISIGHPANILDIGGGFSCQPGQEENFLEMSEIINSFLENELQTIKDLRVIAEPGTFLCESTVTLVTNVIGKRTVSNDTKYAYYLNEGSHGMFTDLKFSLRYEHLHMEILERKMKTQETHQSVLWGPTCDSDDFVCKDVQLPELCIGDSILFKHFGAYSWTEASEFGGNDKPDVIYVVTADQKERLNLL